MRTAKSLGAFSGAAQNTVGYARAKFALATTKGLAVDDHESLSLINDAEEVILPLILPHEEGLFRTRAGVFALPPQYSSIYRVAIDNVPVTLRSNWFEFVQSGIGYRENNRRNAKGESVIPRGEHPLHTDLFCPSKLLFIAHGNERGAKIQIKGVGAEGEIGETIVLNGGDQILTQHVYFDVTSITKDPTVGAVSIASDNIEVGFMYAWQQDSKVKRYFIPNFASCKDQTIRVIAKPRFYPKVSDYDKLQVPFPYAVSLMAQAILAQRSGQMEVSNALKSEALSYIETAMANEKVGEANTVEFQTKAWGLGGLTSRR